MNLLVVYPYIPYPLDRGTYQRTFHLLRELAREHTVDFIALSERGERMEHRPVFEAFCRRVRFVAFEHPTWQRLFPTRLLRLTPSTIDHWRLPQLSSAIDEQIAENHYDLVHICDIVLAQYFLGKHSAIPLSVDRSRVDLQFQLQQTSFRAKTWKDKFLAWENMSKLWWYEKRIARRCQSQVLCGPDDETFVRKHISREAPLRVVPNGVDLAYFGAESESVLAKRPTLLFCGAMDYTPNVDALQWYFSQIHDSVVSQVPEIEVLVVGKSPAPEVCAMASLPGVTVTGSVADVRPYYRKAWLQIVPLRIGGGTRLKIVESLAIGTPVVSTSIGAQGLGLTSGANVLLADSAEVFASEIVRGLKSPPLRQHLRQNGIRTATQHFGWRQIGAKLTEHYRQFEPQPPRRVKIMAVPFDALTMEETLARLGDMIRSGRPHHVATANVDFLVQARSDAALRHILHNASLVLCDGTPLVWLSRALRRALPERVAGSDLVPRLLKTAEQNGWRVFFFGGQPAVLDRAVANVRRDHPALPIAGSFSPPYAPLEKMDSESTVRHIRAARPDILLVSLGCPKQEKWISQNLAAAGVPVCIGVGATIDFLAGSMKRAPRWMRASGLEWIFRLCQEPRRLFKRYATDMVVFGLGAAKEIAATLLQKPDSRRA